MKLKLAVAFQRYQMKQQAPSVALEQFASRNLTRSPLMASQLQARVGRRVSKVVTWLNANESNLIVDSIIIGELRIGILALPRDNPMAQQIYWFADMDTLRGR